MGNLILPENHYSKDIAVDVATICEPLKRYGIVYFCYARFFSNGTAYVLVTHWDSLQHHCKKQYLLSPIVPEQLQVSKFHYFPYMLDIPQEARGIFDQVTHEYQELFGVVHPIYFIENYKDYTDIFIYASAHKGGSLDMVNFCFNNIDVLEKFKFYFRDKAQKLIKNSNKNRIIVPKHMSGFVGLKNDNKSTVDKQSLLKELEPKHYLLPGKQPISITKQELAVLKQLAKGETVKEAANAMGISYRTVEDYLSNLRMKLGLQKKSEITKFLSGFNLLL